MDAAALDFFSGFGVAGSAVFGPDDTAAFGVADAEGFGGTGFDFGAGVFLELFASTTSFDFAGVSFAAVKIFNGDFSVTCAAAVDFVGVNEAGFGDFSSDCCGGVAVVETAAGLTTAVTTSGFETGFLPCAIAFGLGIDVATVGTTFAAGAVVVDTAAVSATGEIVVDGTAPPIVGGGVVLMGLLFLRGVCFVRGETGAVTLDAGESFSGFGGVVTFVGDATTGGTATFDPAFAFTGTATFDPAFDAPPLSPVAN